MKIHEYQGKEILKRYGVPVPRGIPLLQRRRGRQGSRATGRAGLGRQGADPRRRPRQGRRRQAGPVGRRGQQARVRDPGHATGDAPDRTRRAAGAPPVHRGRRGHRQGTLCRHRAGPAVAEDLRDGLERRRDGHRGSGRAYAGEAAQGLLRRGGRADGRGGRRPRPQDRHPGEEPARSRERCFRACTRPSSRPTRRCPRSTR